MGSGASTSNQDFLVENLPDVSEGSGAVGSSASSGPVSLFPNLKDDEVITDEKAMELAGLDEAEVHSIQPKVG